MIHADVDNLYRIVKGIDQRVKELEKDHRASEGSREILEKAEADRDALQARHESTVEENREVRRAIPDDIMPGQTLSPVEGISILVGERDALQARVRELEAEKNSGPLPITHTRKSQDGKLIGVVRGVNPLDEELESLREELAEQVKRAELAMSREAEALNSRDEWRARCGCTRMELDEAKATLSRYQRIEGEVEEVPGVPPADWSYCPDCGGSLDTGWECDSCPSDWRNFVRMPDLATRLHSSLIAQIAKTEEVEADLARVTGEMDEAKAAKRSAEAGERIAKGELQHDRSKFALMASSDAAHARDEVHALYHPVVEALVDLHATVKGECPRLLDGDRDGDANLALRVESALASLPTNEKE